MPLDETEGLPLLEIYCSMLVEEDLKKIQPSDDQNDHKTLEKIKDMFYVNNTIAERVLLTGEAGYGKTVLTLKLIESWSRAKEKDRCKNTSGDKLDGSDKGTNEEEELQECLSVFDLVFYVPLRYSGKEITSVVDLVCDCMPNIDRENIKQMLNDDSIPCAVILDGLDEWGAPSTRLIHGLHDFDCLENCLVFCTMRPWRKVSLKLQLDSSHDKVLHLLGLKPDSIETVIRNVLSKFIEIPPIECEKMVERYSLKAKQSILLTLMKVPLILIASCIIWNEDDKASQEMEGNQDIYYYMSLFYLKLLEITITRANNKDSEENAVRSFLEDKIKSKNESDKGKSEEEKLQSVPRFLRKFVVQFPHTINFFEVIEPVAKLALQDLLSDDTHLVFQKIELEQYLGPQIVDLAMKTGILSQNKVPGPSHQQSVSVSFFHKSFQEFMAAMVIAYGDAESLKSFHSKCTTVDNIMKLSNMITFVSGLEPERWYELCEHIQSAVNSDRDIKAYREKPALHTHGNFGSANLGGNKVQELNKMKCVWHDEMKHNPSYKYKTGSTITSSVFDVYLDQYSDDNMASMVSEIVSTEDNNVAFLCLYGVGGSMSNIIENLSICKTLTSLYIIDIRDSQIIETFVNTLSELQQLQHIAYSGNWRPEDNAVVDALQKLTKLTCVELGHLALTDIMTLKEKPLLDAVIVSRVRNAHFILPSLCQCSQLKHIELNRIDTNGVIDISQKPLLKTVKLYNVQTVCSILSALPQCKHLTTLHISGCTSKEEHDMLSDALPQLEHLHYLQYDGRFRHDAVDVVSALQRLTHLKHIQLERISLDDTHSLLVSNMVQLDKVELAKINMSPRRWKELFTNLLCVKRTVHVILTDTNIDDDTLTTIRKFPRVRMMPERQTSMGEFQKYFVLVESVISFSTCVLV